MIGQISLFSGHRLGVFLDKIIPLIGEVVRGGEGEEGGEEEVELKEMCFQTYESLVERFFFVFFCSCYFYYCPCHLSLLLPLFLSPLPL